MIGGERMDENEIREHRFRFFTEKGLDIALEQSKAFSALFTAVIAGLLALVVYDKVSFWSATLFLIADAMAVMGLAWNLLHMSYTSKLMLVYAAYFAGEEVRAKRYRTLSEDRRRNPVE